MDEIKGEQVKQLDKEEEGVKKAQLPYDAKSDGLKAGFLPKAERPYHGDIKGRIEDAARDNEDEVLRDRGEAIEKQRTSEGQEWAPQHGNVGFAGSYEIDPLVER